MVISGDGSSRSKSTMWGWLLVGIGSLVLLGFLFTAFISHLLPPSNYTLIAAIQNDSLSSHQNWNSKEKHKTKIVV
ncbi:hypothetical protein ERO13_D07G127200v2 [Gossypium hirsutum]|uniref:Uncharacterized protein n=2 Tax=Gossypium TaxID=3633 RepID=A0A5J5QXB7_GOSBA|nr:hypothetical protein ES319_D07G136200v1 [Gossypium barbadense]KAB2021401.1 hypothetical protein ES319_D07G136200v1 [Gossypium barbadense]KAG4138319.1 hypothetical protein ERO13_D07G127200v2 [Gossypium hirsutum]TYG61398.1 hypothetical protein ES288_D07G144900v1 [Gossypium darwinii]